MIDNQLNLCACVGNSKGSGENDQEDLRYLNILSWILIFIQNRSIFFLDLVQLWTVIQGGPKKSLWCDIEQTCWEILKYFLMKSFSL